MERMDVTAFFKNIHPFSFNLKDTLYPWTLVSVLKDQIASLLKILPKEHYHISGSTAVHKNAIVEDFAVLKNYIIVEEGAVVKSGAYLREGTYIGKNVSIGANCEIKQSIILNLSRIAHLNYIGNSIVGEDVNIEAGAVLANHFNERENKEIEVMYEGKRIKTGIVKFGSLVGDGSRIGANSVLNPGTLLFRNSIVGRLEHVNQIN